MVIDPDIYIPSESPDREFVYNNETQELIYQVPLAFTRYNIKKNADELFNDDSSQYFTYSGGWNATTVSKEKDGRYKNISLKAYSGDSFKFYFNVGEVITESGFYLSGPVTTSGVYKTFTAYSGENDAITNAITFTSPTDNSTVFTMPSVKNLRYMRLYHSPITASGTYRLYQFLPRTLIQVDDLEADVIDTVTLRVSDSIVIGPNLIGDKTILGRKIVDGTVSGVLITDGTITGSKVVANTISGVLITANSITADKLSVTQLDAVAANMGNLTVNSGITIGNSGYLWAGAGTASAPTTGLKIYTTSGVSRLTTYNNSIPQINITTSGALSAGVNNEIILNSGGIFFNTQTLSKPNTNLNRLWLDEVALSGRASMLKFTNAPWDKTVGYFAPFYNIVSGEDTAYVVSQAGNGSPGQNYAETIYSTNAVTSFAKGQADIKLYAEAAFEYSTQSILEIRSNENNSYVKFTTTIPGYSTKPQLIIQRGLITPEKIILNSPTTVSGALEISGNFSVNSDKFVIASDTGNTDIRGNTTISGTLTVAGDVNLTNIASDVNINTNKVSITASNGNTDIRGNVTVSGSISHRDAGILARTANQTVNAGTSARVQLNTAGTGNILGNATTYEITVTNAGLYIVNAAVSSTTTSLPWSARQNATSFTTGTQILPGLTFNDGRQLNTTVFYLNANDTVGLFVNNTGGSSATVTGGLRVVRLT